MWMWLKKNSGTMGVLVGLSAFIISMGTLAFSAFRYVDIRTTELRQQRFENYHRIIKALSTVKDESGAPLKVVSQKAYIFELGNFEEYGDLTIRILNSLKEDWKKETAFPDIESEMSIVIEKLENR